MARHSSTRLLLEGLPFKGDQEIICICISECILGSNPRPGWPGSTQFLCTGVWEWHILGKLNKKVILKTQKLLPIYQTNPEINGGPKYVMGHPGGRPDWAKNGGGDVVAWKLALGVKLVLNCDTHHTPNSDFQLFARSQVIKCKYSRHLSNPKPPNQTHL